MSTRLFMLFCVFALLGSCQEEVVVSDKDLYHTWEATAFISVESMTYTKAKNKPILLAFNKEGSYHLKLDVNSCGGTFDTDKDHRIEMTLPICTEACCDSPFSVKLASMLPEVTSYTIEGKTLKLNVPQWGWIELEMVE